MLQLIQVTSVEHNAPIRQLFLEYIKWLHENINREYELPFDVNELLDDFMKGVDIFYPPYGSLYLANFGDEFVGIGCLKQLSEDIGEIKRMFVKEEYHGKGIGKAILDQLVANARSKGFSKIRLDSPKVSTNAHGLYQSRGFRHIGKYEGSEGAEAQADLFVYMELVL